MTGSTVFEEFVAARSTALLRTAYLLTRDHGQAEALLQTALTKACLAWQRSDGDPEPYVRRILVTTYASWWRRKWNGEMPTEELPEEGRQNDRIGEDGDLWAAMAIHDDRNRSRPRCASPARRPRATGRDRARSAASRR